MIKVTTYYLNCCCMVSCQAVYQCYVWHYFKYVISCLWWINNSIILIITCSTLMALNNYHTNGFMKINMQCIYHNGSMFTYHTKKLTYRYFTYKYMPCSIWQVLLNRVNGIQSHFFPHTLHLCFQRNYLISSTVPGCYTVVLNHL